MKLIRSFGYAFNGLYQALSQTNLRILFFVAMGVVSAGFYYNVTRMEWVILLMAIGFVISMELINTSIENLTDLVTKEQNPLAGKVKDVAAAAALFSSIVAAIIGIIIFAKYLTPNL